MGDELQQADSAILDVNGNPILKDENVPQDAPQDAPHDASHDAPVDVPQEDETAPKLEDASTSAPSGEKEDGQDTASGTTSNEPAPKDAPLQASLGELAQVEAPAEDAHQEAEDAHQQAPAAQDDTEAAPADDKPAQDKPEDEPAKTDAPQDEAAGQPSGMAPVAAVGAYEAQGLMAPPLTGIDAVGKDEKLTALDALHDVAQPIAEAVSPELVGSLKDAGNKASEALHGLRLVEAELAKLPSEAKAIVDHLKTMGAHFVASMEHMFKRQ